MQKRLIKDDKTLFLIFSLLLVFASSLILKNILETKTPKTPELYPVSTENQAYFEVETGASTLPSIGEQVKVSVNLATHPNDSYYSAAVVLQWDESILEYAGKSGHTSRGNFLSHPLAGNAGKYIFLFVTDEASAISHSSADPEKFVDVTFNVLDNTRDANVSISLSETAVQLAGTSGGNVIDQSLSSANSVQIPSADQNLDPQEICDQGGGSWKIDFPNSCKDRCGYAKNPDMTCAQVISEGCNCGPNLCWNTDTQQCEAYSIKDVCGPNADLNADGECECEVPFDNCDHDWSNGCEVDLRNYQRNG